MAKHKMNFKALSPDENMAVFACSECGRTVNFHNPEGATPRFPLAVKKGTAFYLPEDGEDIIGRTLGEKCDA